MIVVLLVVVAALLVVLAAVVVARLLTCGAVGPLAGGGGRTRLSSRKVMLDRRFAEGEVTEATRRARPTPLTETGQCVQRQG